MTPDDAEDEVRQPTYAFKPSLIGAPSKFTLEPETLHWDTGRLSGRIRYDRIRAIRMSFRPVTTQPYRFLTEIRSPDSPKLQISSVSWRSMVQQERLDADYAAFIIELHRRLSAAGSRARLSAGLPVINYWVGVLVFGVTLVGSAGLVLRAINPQQWAATAVLLIFFAVFAYQLGNYFYRNRPGRYASDALPPMLLPRS
jgi:hypothetical protein